MSEEAARTKKAARQSAAMGAALAVLRPSRLSRQPHFLAIGANLGISVAAGALAAGTDSGVALAAAWLNLAAAGLGVWLGRPELFPAPLAAHEHKRTNGLIRCGEELAKHLGDLAAPESASAADEKPLGERVVRLIIETPLTDLSRRPAATALRPSGAGEAETVSHPHPGCRVVQEVGRAPRVEPSAPRAGDALRPSPPQAR